MVVITKATVSKKRPYTFLVLFVFLALTCLGCGGSSGDEDSRAVILSWQPPPDSDLAGYTIHYGEHSLEYTHSLTVVGKQTYSVISNLPSDKYFYFSVSAFDDANNHSILSSEVSTVNIDN